MRREVTRKVILVLCSLFIISLFSISVFSIEEFSKVKLNISGINELVAHPSNAGEFLVASVNGTFRTINYGQNWIKVNVPAQPNKVAFASNLIAITTSDPRAVLAISNDNGRTWKSFNQEVFISTLNLQLRDPNETLRLKGIAIDSANKNIIYVGSVQHSAGIKAIVPHLFKSIDGGITWNQSDSGFYYGRTSVNSILIDPFNSNNIYIATNEKGAFQGEGLYSSSNEGINWGRVGKKSIDKDVYEVVLANNDYVLAATKGGLYKRKIFDSFWSNAFFEVTSAYDLAKDKNNNIYAITQQGLYLNDGFLENWTKISNISNEVLNNVAVDSSGAVIVSDAKDNLFISIPKEIVISEKSGAVTSEEKIDEDKILETIPQKAKKVVKEGIISKIKKFFEKIFE